MLMKHQKYSMDFGKKEKVLNYTCQTYQLSRPNKVGAVMALIRECQPHTIEEWEQWYFEKIFLFIFLSIQFLIHIFVLNI